MLGNFCLKDEITRHLNQIWSIRTLKQKLTSSSDSAASSISLSSDSLSGSSLSSCAVFSYSWQRISSFWRPQVRWYGVKPPQLKQFTSAPRSRRQRTSVGFWRSTARWSDVRPLHCSYGNKIMLDSLCFAVLHPFCKQLNWLPLSFNDTYLCIDICTQLNKSFNQ